MRTVMSLTLSLLSALLFLNGCKPEARNFGATNPSIVAPSPSPIPVLVGPSLGEQLLNSSNLIFSAGVTDVLTNGLGEITQISNQRAPSSFSTPLILVPDSQMIGRVTGDSIELQSNTDGHYFRTSFAETGLTYQDVTFFAVVQCASMGTLISFNPLDRFVQAFELQSDSSMIRARLYSSPTDSAEKSLSRPSAGDCIIGASLAGATPELQLAVNGVLAGATSLTGLPTEAFTMSRFLELGSSLSTQTLYLKRLLFFNRVLTLSEIGALTLVLAQQHSIAGINLDPALQLPEGGGGTPPPVDTVFPIIQASIENSCVSCHSAWQGATANYYRQVGLITAGDPDGSKLYYRLKNSGGGAGPKNMPLGAAAMSGTDLDRLRNWILSLN